MIVHAFIATAHDEWILRYHLSVYKSFCDHACCVLDRAPNLIPICREFGVEFTEWSPADCSQKLNFSGWLHDEGVTRQIAWNMAAKHSPDWIALGDPDENPTPDVMDFVHRLDERVDVYLAHWCNLIGSASTVICGDNRWSWQSKLGNKKAMMARRRNGVTYKYEPVRQHSRMEPNATRLVLDDTHLLVDTPLMIHYKLAAWNRWLYCQQRIHGNQWTEAEAQPKTAAPAEWHWPGLPSECV